MGPEELTNSDEAKVSAEGRAESAAVSTFRGPEPAPPRLTGRFSATQWAVGLVVVALLAYPVVRWTIKPGTGSSPASPNPQVLGPSAQAMLNRSFALYQAGKYEEAIVLGTALVKDNPNSADGWNNLAASYAAVGRWDDAIRSAQQALRIVPDHKLAIGNLTFAQKAQASGAKPPAPAGPGTLPYLLNLSAEQYRAGKFHECVENASKARELDPVSSVAYNNLGACYAALGMFDEAIRAEQEGVRLDPGNQLAKNNLAYAMQQKKIRDSLRESK
jgi:Flp pilus assembly protein TadD